MTEPRDAVDRLLKAELRATAGALPAATPACVDAETFAAWVEGALPVTQSNALESHAADCARCQAMMAAFARTEAAAAAALAPKSARPDWLVRWLMPAAAGAAAIALAVWLTRSESPTTPETPAPSAPSQQQMAQGDAKQQPKLASAPPAQGRLADKAAGAREEGRARNQLAKDTAKDKKEDANKRAAEQSAARQNETKVTRADAQPVQAPVPPPVPVAAPTVPPAATISGLPQSALPITLPPPPPPATSTAAGASATTSTVTQAPTFRAAVSEPRPAGVIDEFSSSLSRQAQGAAGGGGGGRGGGGASSVLPSRQWRIYASGVVEQSNNAGASWARVTLDPEVRVTTGSAPSLNVCWLAGRQGAVLISLNADRFNKLVFPESVDLTSIRATNAREATITTADGRTFVTTDGGITWTVRTPHQNPEPGTRP